MDREWENVTLPAWQLAQEAKEQGTAHFATMHICHLKNAELEPEYQYKGRVVLRGVVKDSGRCIHRGICISNDGRRDVTARLPDCVGQADSKMKDAPKLLKIPKSEIFGNVFHVTNGKYWFNTEDPVVPLERNLYGHLPDY